MKKDFGKEIWRSTYAYYKGWGFEFFFGFLITFPAICFFLIFTIPIISIIDIFQLILRILYLLIFCLIIFFIMFLMALRKRVCFIVIYERGIAIRKQNLFLYLKKDYIPFESITGADYEKVVETYYFNLIRHDVRKKYLYIYFNNRKQYKLDCEFVSNYRKCITLITKYKKG